MSPQFHVVYDNFFQTVHSDEGKSPTKWTDIIVFDCFRSDFDDSDFVPELANEWLTPVDIVRIQKAELNH